jgi:hypothetical protein
MIKRFGFVLALFASVTLGWAQIGPIPGMGPLPFASTAAACGTPAVTSIGTNQNVAGATLTLTGVTVPAGSLIVVVVAETGGGGTVADGVNTYSTATNQVDAQLTTILTIFFAPNATLSAGTITYTKAVSGDATNISAFYSSNILTASPQDAAVTASASSTTNTPSVTSGTPAQSGELFVGAVSDTPTTNQTFSQDTTHGWAAPPNSIQNAGATLLLAGGTQVNAGTGTKIFSPTFSGGSTPSIAIAVVGFKHC